jgi:hypothetical protein
MSSKVIFGLIVTTLVSQFNENHSLEKNCPKILKKFYVTTTQDIKKYPKAISILEVGIRGYIF